MKLYSTFNKLPLIALLSLGLAGSPLVAGADEDDRGRQGHSQKDRGKSHDRSDYRRDYRGYRHGRNDGYREGYYNGYRHGYSSGNYHGRPHGYRYYGHRPRHDYSGFMFGFYSDDLDVIFRD